MLGSRGNRSRLTFYFFFFSCCCFFSLYGLLFSDFQFVRFNSKLPKETKKKQQNWSCFWVANDKWHIVTAGEMSRHETSNRKPEHYRQAFSSFIFSVSIILRVFPFSFSFFFCLPFFFHFRAVKVSHLKFSLHIHHNGRKAVGIIFFGFALEAFNEMQQIRCILNSLSLNALFFLWIFSIHLFYYFYNFFCFIRFFFAFVHSVWRYVVFWFNNGCSSRNPLKAIKVDERTRDIIRKFGKDSCKCYETRNRFIFISKFIFFIFSNP